MSRFGTQSEEKIRKEVDILIPPNTKKSKATIWKQFLEFCEEKNYRIAAGTSVEEIAEILEDWGFNMKKKNSEDYKESVVKVKDHYDMKYFLKFFYISMINTMFDIVLGYVEFNSKATTRNVFFKI